MSADGIVQIVRPLVVWQIIGFGWERPNPTEKKVGRTTIIITTKKLVDMVDGDKLEAGPEVVCVT